MKNEKFYIIKVGEENELGLLPQEVYNRLVNGEDQRVYTIGGIWLFVKSEHKQEVENEYGLKFKPFSKDFIERMTSYGEVERFIYEICKENKTLAYWENKTFSDLLTRKVYFNTVKEIYNMNDEDAIECIKNEGYDLIMGSIIKKLMYEMLMKELKQEYKALTV